ncbi:TPA: hypothetical protein GF206_24255 [Escherichia coli]|nr:hypothetical protein [Escherichia coli]HAH3006122.1 hypothetical protein [Escherichia coli]HAH3016344.1 hypothetical protein [Escherichia coli]
MWRWPLRRQTAKLSRKSARCWKRLPVFWVFVWRITCDGKTAPGCGCTPAVSGGDGGFHQQNHVGAGGWGAGLRHYGIAVAGDKKKQPA